MVFAMVRDIDVATLRGFLTVVETGGFTAASTRLNRSQSAVSMQIKKLEDILGAAVFVRVPGGVELTAQGEQLTGFARRIVTLHDQALAQVGRDLVTGTARIGVMDDYATHILPERFADFGHRHPGIRLEVTTGFTSALIERLGEDFDVVLATQAVGTKTGRVLRRERTCWAYAVRKPLPDLSVVPLALLAPGNLFRGWAIDALDRAGRPWHLVYSSSSISAIESAAAAGIALTVVKAGTARRDLRLLGRAEGLPALPASEIALHRAPDRLSPAARKLADYLEAALLEP